MATTSLKPDPGNARLLHTLLDDKTLRLSFLGGAIPVLGAVPSAIGAVYSAAYATAQVAVVCFRGIKAVISKDQHQYSFLNDAKNNVTNYFLASGVLTLGVCTLGLSNLAYFLITRNETVQVKNF